MFYSPFYGNEHKINTLTRKIRERKAELEAGTVKLRILGFCTSFGSHERNLRAAKNRSNQVKSYFITHERLREDHYRTSNHTRAWNGMNDVVAVVYFVRTDEIDPTERFDMGGEPVRPVAPCPEPRLSHVDVAAPVTVCDPAVVPSPSLGRLLAVKTNVASLAAGVTNIGAEYAWKGHWSVDLLLVYSPYTIARSYTVRLLAVQPELRYWLGRAMRGHFVGAHLHFGVYNVAFDRRDRYQDDSGFYGFGLSYGYSLALARRWNAELTIGAGYLHTSYDTYYNVPNGALYDRDTVRDYWGLTRLGVSIVYRFDLNGKEVAR